MSAWTTPAPWSAEEITRAAALWADGWSASQIAGRLSAEFCSDRSRSGVMGIIHRNRDRFAARRAGKGRPAREAQPKRPHPAARSSRPAKGKSPVIPPPAAFPAVAPVSIGKAEAAAYDAASRHVPLADLEGRDCRWPVNDAAPGGEHLFCGRPADGAYRYCEHHFLRSCGTGTRGERHAERSLMRAGRAA